MGCCVNVAPCASRAQPSIGITSLVTVAVAVGHGNDQHSEATDDGHTSKDADRMMRQSLGDDAGSDGERSEHHKVCAHSPTLHGYWLKVVD